MARTKAQPQIITATAPADEPSVSFTETLKNVASMYGVSLPDWKRTLCAFVASVTASVAVCSIGLTLTELVMLTAYTASGSMFLSTIIYVLGFVLSIYAAIKVSQRVGMYIITGDIDRDISKLKNKVTGLFGRRPIVAA